MLFPNTKSGISLPGEVIVAQCQKSIGALFVSVVAETDARLAMLLRRKLLLSAEEDRPADAAAAEWTQLISAAQDHGGEASVVRLCELDAKLIDVQWRARRSVSIQLLAVAADAGAATVGDTFEEFCARAERAPMPAAQKLAEVQRLVDRCCCMWPSLTTHPTSPMSLAYTQAGLELERVLCGGGQQQQDAVVKALRAIRDTSMDVTVRPSRKKTPEEEVEELVAVLSVIDDSVMAPTLRLRQALDRHGFASVEIKHSLLDPCVWGCGDGDGNPAQTATTLTYQVLRLRLAACAALLVPLTSLIDKISSLTTSNNDGSSAATASAAAGSSKATTSMMIIDDSTLAALRAARAQIVNEIKEINSDGSTDPDTGLPRVNLNGSRKMGAKSESALLESLLGALKTVAQKAAQAANLTALHDKAFELLHRVFTFGLYLARTDVRHNSVDITQSVAVILSAFSFQPLVDLVMESNSSNSNSSRRATSCAGNKNNKSSRSVVSPWRLYCAFMSASDTVASHLVQQALTSQELLRQIDDAFFSSEEKSSSDSMRKQLSAMMMMTMTNSGNKKQNSNGELGAAIDVCVRVFGRCRVIAQHASSFQKLIIAEARGPSNFLSAMFLLRSSGSIIGEPGASILITPLFESRADLASAPTTMNLLLCNDLVLRHVEHCNMRMLLVMIAKSDTARLSGVGVVGAQEACYAELLAISPRQYSSKTDSNGDPAFEVALFLGGGEDAVRGGGRIVESPNVVLSAASRFAQTTVRIATTIQGVQMQTVFGSVSIAQYTIEAWCAQSLIACAKARGLLQWRTLPRGANRRLAIRQTDLMYAEAQQQYERIIGTEVIGNLERMTIVKMFADYPMSAVAQNKSSRPGARTQTDDPLRGRAIGLDIHGKHGCAYVLGTAGIAKALLSMNAQARGGNIDNNDNNSNNNNSYKVPIGVLHHAFLANKSMRDFVRIQSVILYQKDYPSAWALRGGEPKTLQERQALCAAYEAKEGRDCEPREFLAWMEDQDQIEASLLVNAITGRQMVSPMVDSDDVPRTSLDMPLRVGWPTIVRDLRARAAQCAFARYMEILAARLINAEKRHGHASKLSASLTDIIYYAYCGSRVGLSSPSFNMSITSPVKEAELRQGMTPFMKKPLLVPDWFRMTNAATTVSKL